jgi:glutamate---cysteine ligase / carboxylate-amine ligase
VCVEPELSAARNEMTRLLIEENRWRAKRFGTRATFLHQKSRRNLPISDWLTMAMERFGDAASTAGDDWVWAHARNLLRDGGSAESQLRRYADARNDGANRAQALRSVVDMLLRETIGVYDASAPA